MGNIVKIKNIILASIAAIFAIALIGYSIVKKPYDGVARHDTLIIGTTGGYAPWVSVNEQGVYEGFDIDVAKALAQKMGKQLELKDLGSMTSLLLALDQGSIDAIIWGMSITKGRLSRIAMIRYYGETQESYPLLFWKQIPAGITGLSDMDGKTICVEPSSAQEMVLNKFENIIKKPTEKVDDALLNLQYGKVDAALVEPAIAKKFMSKFPEIQMLDVPIDVDDREHGVGVCIRPDNLTLINDVTRAIQSLQQEKLIEGRAAYWGIP